MGENVRSQRSWRQRWLPHPVLSGILVCLWLALINHFELGSLLVGIVLGIGIPHLTHQVWTTSPAVRSWWRVVEFAAIVAWDVVVANLQVAWLILFKPADQLRSRWFRVPLELSSPEAITLLAGTITMTPGTVSCDVSEDGRQLLVHGLDIADESLAVQHIKQRYEARLRRIFP
jgi:multicomponent K+:H+ antiporter subunit E